MCVFNPIFITVLGIECAGGECTVSYLALCQFECVLVVSVCIVSYIY